MKVRVETTLDAVLAVCFVAIVATMVLRVIHP